MSACARHWERLQDPPRFGADWSLHAKSVTERAARALAAWIDRIYQLLQPKAEYLGHGFQAEAWTITLFSEEVVRGGSLGFVLSMLLRHLDPLLRQAAHLGRLADRQPRPRRRQGRGGGFLAFRAARDTSTTPTVVVADQVMGDEEIPEGVTAVIAPDVTDIVSHVAVRARNAGILFASCHDAATLQRLKAMRGKFLQLEVKSRRRRIVLETRAAAAVTPAPGQAPGARPAVRDDRSRNTPSPRRISTSGPWAENPATWPGCAGKLPEWIQLPASVALPFGVFERVLKLGVNQETRQALSRN